MRLTIFLILFIVASWSIATPIFEFPDEQAHIESVEFLTVNKRMPVGKEWDMTLETKLTQEYLGIFRNEYGQNKYTYHPEYHVEYTDSLTGEYEKDILALNNADNRDQYVWKEAARYPRLYYDFLTVWYKAVANQDIIIRTFLLRIANALFAVATVFFTYKIGLIIFAKKSYASTLAIMVGLQPMFSFLSAGVNSDNLHILLYTMFFYYCILFIRSGWDKINLLYFALIIIADFYTKPQAYVMAPILFLALLLRWITQKSFIKEYKKAVLLGFIVILGILPKEGNTLLSLVWKGNIPYSYPTNLNVHPPDFWEFVKFSVNKLYAQNLVWYWGVFKWLGIVLPRFWWWTANRLVLVASIGVVIGIYKIYSQTKKVLNILPILFLLGASSIYMFAIFWFDWQYARGVGYSIGVQARYYFPVIVAHMTLLLYGLTSFGWSPKVQTVIRKLTLLFFISLQIAGIYRLMSSYYDMSSLNTFIIQVSQYKPWFAKGDWWYLWIGGYLASITILTWTTLSSRAEIEVNEKTTTLPLRHTRGRKRLK